MKVTTDETFGPIILLSQGGSEWDRSIDAAAAFPPLNMMTLFSLFDYSSDKEWQDSPTEIT